MRPNPVQWIWYVYGGRLPQRCREWVLHDVTCRTWALRHLLRAVVQILPALLALFVFFTLLRGPLWVVLMATGLGVIVSVYYSLSYMTESCDVRLQKYGYPPRHAQHVREQRLGSAGA
ncbi:hypothetical protein GCM10010174_28960 [Kutzneria viridogrisea]|uniref:Uncharacterized protein n=2 Tax=Kutzneria TaxID=43356 RepID=W5WAI5_9PSEU|nr:DUF5313 family protein [Kutzneria albida]AHH97957.1 hypothetical protein KALB_4595 [Kutzneria albida DSM 43870]MBA8924386.1 putative membrane protein YdbT with pleckstrin-like domain [Kutzneria viridogrisea]